jgi:AcrR family transcriptional regulator
MSERTTPRNAPTARRADAPGTDTPSDPASPDGVTSGGSGGPATATRLAAGTGTRREQVLDAAQQSFGTKGYEATSLDQLAVELGVRKQTILYYYPSKAELLDAVIDSSSAELADVLERTLVAAGGGFDRIEAIVRSVFRLALRRPELLGVLREVARLGPPAATRLSQNLEPLVQRAREFLVVEMDQGHFRRSDPSLLLLSVYSTVVGVATEVEVLRAVGIEPTLRSTATRRRELLQFLRRALVEDAAG